MFQFKVLFLSLLVFVSSCAVAAKNELPAAAGEGKVVSEKASDKAGSAAPAEAKSPGSKSPIMITPNSPAATVKTFYQALREKRFRDAMLMTNLKGAVEGLSNEEIEELRPYFEQIASQTPEEVRINGEQIVGETASVFIEMPDENNKLQVTPLPLRLENKEWKLLVADQAAEAEIKKVGKNYLFNLLIDTHHSEVEQMLERITKAEYVYSLQNGGAFADISVLVSQGLLPVDIQGSESTGYRFKLVLSADKKTYFATAEPEKYGKSGKLSYLLEFDGKKSRIKSDDNKGMPLKK